MYSSIFNLKLISCIAALGLWYCFSFDKIITHSFYVLLCFDEESHIKQAPENILVTVQARRSDFYNFDYKQCAIYIDKQYLNNNRNYIYLDAQKILLPMEISLVSCKPSSIMIEVERT